MYKRQGYPLAFDSAEALLELCDERGITIAEAARINEEALRSDEEIAAGLDAIWDTMSTDPRAPCFEKWPATRLRSELALPT